MSVTNTIKSLLDAYTARGLVRDQMIFSDPENDIQEAANSFIDAVVLTEALNEGRKPDFNNPLERKFPIFWFMPSTGRRSNPDFFYNDYDFVLDNTSSFVSARLVFFDKDIAKYAATEFPEVYMPFMKFPEQ